MDKTVTFVEIGLYELFTNNSNIKYLSNELNVSYNRIHEYIKKWTYTKELQNREYIDTDLTESLKFINSRFIREFKTPKALSYRTGKYPRVNALHHDEKTPSDLTN